MVSDAAAEGRVLEIRIEAGGVCKLSWRALEGELQPLGGSATCLGLQPQAPLASPRLVFALGEATRRRLPSSGRVHIGARSPLTGGYTEGAVGGGLAWALLGLFGEDEPVVALCIDAAPGLDAGEFVLELEPADTGAGGIAAKLVKVPDLPGNLAQRLVASSLVEKRGWQTAAIAAGPGARRGVPYGILVTGDDVAVTTGRGGLGTVLARLGLAAVVVKAPELGTRAEAPIPAALARATKASPRLGERARGGTLELFVAFAARGDLWSRNRQVRLGSDEAASLTRDASAAEVAHHGCRGCPTPCGLVFERPGGGRGGARFGATYALGPNLGFAGEGAFDAALQLLAACDHEGLDAREAGACLALLARATELGLQPDAALPQVEFGSLLSMLAAIEQLPAMGSLALAERLGLLGESFDSGGQSARPEADLASTLGQVIATAGNDPMRSFPFLVTRPSGASESDGCVELPDGTRIEARALDPREAAGKGQLVAWHEDLAAALDTVGFCSFSTAGLLVDGALALDTLVDWIAPAAIERGAGAGRRFVAMGAKLVMARRALEIQWRGALKVPAWAQEALAQPGMLDGYLAARGEAAPDLDLGARKPRPAPASISVASEAAAQPQARGDVTVLATGALGEALGDGGVCVQLDLPATCRTVLEALVKERPAAAALVFDADARLLPSVWRAGQPVGEDVLVLAGEKLELLLVIGGG